MGYELIKIGTLPNDGTGDSLRTAFEKINMNFESLFILADVGAPEKIVTSSNGDSIPSAFHKLNSNFAILSTKYKELDIVELNTKDPFRMTFQKVNTAFTNAYSLLDPAFNTQVEIIDPIYPSSTNSVSDASILSNFSITNNYNIYVNNDLPNNTSPILTTALAYGSQEFINIGDMPNDGLGDPLRTAFEKINNNFSSLFFTSTSTSTAYSHGNTANQVIYEIPVVDFTQGIFQIRSQRPDNTDSQSITVSAQITNNGSDVKFTGYGLTISDSTYLTSYDMTVSSGNVRIVVNPLVNNSLFHFISAQVTVIGEETQGIDIELDGIPGSYLATEDMQIITTE